MAGPITWRNVGGSPVGGANGLLAAGQQQMAQGLQTLQNLFATNAKEDAANRDAVKDYNTNKFLDQVASTDLATLGSEQGRAELNALRQQFGAAIDQAGTRNAIDQRLTAAQTQAINQGKFEDFTTERGQRELVDNIRGLAAQGDKAGVEKILNDNQFLQEGDLRKELSGVFDDAQQRQYRQNSENRAVSAEGRSAASHALSMESGRENLNFARASHKETLRKIGDDNLADQIAMEAFNGTKGANEAQAALISDIAKSNNVSVLPDGTIDLKGVDPEVQDRIGQQLQEAGAGGNSATAARQRVVQMARDAGLGTAATQAALQRYDTVQSFDALAPEDQAKVQQETASATSDITATQKQLTDTFNRKSKDNPFMAPSNDVTADSNRIVEAAAKKYDDEWFSTDINRTSLSKDAVDLMQNGISLKLDGEDLTGVIPPSIIERALLENGANKFLAEGGTVRNLVETYVKENPGIQKQIKESQGLVEQFQKDMSKLNSEKIKIENSIGRARKTQKGVTVSNNDWVDAVINRRNASAN